MKENDKTLMVSCDMRDINLIGKCAIEVLNILESVLKETYFKEDIERGIEVLSNIKEYADNMKKLEVNNKSSNYESIECDSKPEPSAYELRLTLDDSFWDTRS